MKNIMEELASLINTEIPEGHQSLGDSHTNLERVADYCEDTYHRAHNKKEALDATKNYTTQSLASVAYQINTLAYNYIQLMDLQTQQLNEMQSQMNHIAQTIMIHKEKIARREIGVLTGNKVNPRQYKIVAPKNPEKPIKYVRKPIDYMLLDNIGHGVVTSNPTSAAALSTTTTTRQIPKEQYRTTPIQQNTSPIVVSKNSHLGPAPATKPPTPPQLARAGNTGTLGKTISKTGTLGKSSREYRTPSIVTTPQVPSHYAPNYPMSHRKRSSISSDHSGGGNSSIYNSLPMPPSQQVATHVNLPSAGMMQNYPPPPPITSYDSDRNSMPDPPPPLNALGGHHNLSDDQSHFGMHTLGRNLNNLHFMRSGSQSPPLPPPPPSDDEHHDFGRPRNQGSSLAPIVPDDQNLPGWVPKDYIEKVVAIYDYYADKDDELSFQESSVLYVLKKNDDGWWEGAMDGVTGLFPGNYVEPCV